MIVILTKGRVAMVDQEDLDRVNEFNWCAVKKRGDTGYYAMRAISCPGGPRKYQYLHQFILGINRVDHENGDGLDCRRFNLRPATALENNRAFRRKAAGTTSRFRGVSWVSDRQKWLSQIHTDGKTIPLGRFDSEEDAARKYDAKARELFGEFASPNFP